ncbi:hypothetical protein SARC_08461 [Sphaeroforma arctica JP610]|uniref:RGS domain-containing protein n=1 Tax=Sphaeroforma arctica JP610 TaxID=667725 RepID=A0A0L0FR22_9EUKA|nr:hypothetical protein SARC_08461 [Sphaeroforma arctica JP610]KNC79134.1 hypothetical protein SARC_08461 [Sphaeroforma arctica JP610]|eukprot:XP_014153036.1 hypothetical protein SARC_08461 [Sphaeroforma arctica JP610]
MLRHGFFSIQSAIEDKQFRDDKSMLLDKEMLQRFYKNSQPLEKLNVTPPLHSVLKDAIESFKPKAKGGFQPFRMFNNALSQSASGRLNKGQLTLTAKSSLEHTSPKKKLASTSTQPNTQASSEKAYRSSFGPSLQEKGFVRSSSFLMRGISFPNSNLNEESCRPRPIQNTCSAPEVECFSSNMDMFAIPRLSDSDHAGMSSSGCTTPKKKSNKLSSYSFDMFGPRQRRESTQDQVQFGEQLRRPITAQSKAKTGTSLKKSKMLRKGSVSASKKNAAVKRASHPCMGDGLLNSRLPFLTSLRPAKQILSEVDSLSVMCQKIYKNLPMQYKEMVPGVSKFCFQGSHFIAWATENDTRSRNQAIDLGNVLLLSGMISNISSDEQTFKTESLFALTASCTGSATSEIENLCSRTSGSMQRTTMNELLQDTEGVEALYQFLSKEYCEEVLLFVLCVVGFRDTADREETIEIQAQEIFDTFILPNAKLQINISQQLLDEVSASMETKAFSLDMFDVVEREMMVILERDKFSRFKKEYFATAKQGLTRNVGTIG